MSQAPSMKPDIYHGDVPLLDASIITYELEQMMLERLERRGWRKRGLVERGFEKWSTEIRTGVFVDAFWPKMVSWRTPTYMNRFFEQIARAEKVSLVVVLKILGILEKLV